jgi:hypothetical protein
MLGLWGKRRQVTAVTLPMLRLIKGMTFVIWSSIQEPDMVRLALVTAAFPDRQKKYQLSAQGNRT